MCIRDSSCGRKAYSEKRLTVAYWGLIITLIGTMATLGLSCYQSIKVETRIKREKAIEFGKQLNEEVYDGYTDIAINIYKSHLKNDSQEDFLSWIKLVTDSPQRAHTGLLDSEIGHLLRIRSSLNKFTNFMERYCQSYQANTVDRCIMDASAMQTIGAFAELLKPYMDEIRTTDESQWQPIYDVTRIDQEAKADKLGSQLAEDGQLNKEPALGLVARSLQLIRPVKTFSSNVVRFFFKNDALFAAR